MYMGVLFAGKFGGDYGRAASQHHDSAASKEYIADKYEAVLDISNEISELTKNLFTNDPAYKRMLAKNGFLTLEELFNILKEATVEKAKMNLIHYKAINALFLMRYRDWLEKESG